MFPLATATIAGSLPPLHPHTATTAIADMGASDHYLTPSFPVAACTTAPHTIIQMATGESKSSTTGALLSLPPTLSNAARTGYIIEGFTNNLISLGKLCDDNCIIVLDKRTLIVRDHTGRTIFTGS
jgi:hypothetical protein